MVWEVFRKASEIKSRKLSVQDLKKKNKQKNTRLYLYDDDFKLCGAAQLISVGRKNICLMRFMGNPGKMQLIMGLNLCFFITFVYCFGLFRGWGEM